MSQFKNKTVAELLMIHVAAMETLRERGVLRSANNPTGDLAEYLFCAAFGWQLARNSEKGFDAKDQNGSRFQIKGRRLHRQNKSRQMSAIRNLRGFDFLAAVLFDDDYRIVRAALIPAIVVSERTTYIEYTNSYKFMLRDDVWSAPGVADVTDRLRVVENS